MDRQNLTKYPAGEDQKPKILVSGHNPPPKLAQSCLNHNDLSVHTDASDSIPRLRTDSSSSEHILSPDITCEKEVQSESKWNELDINGFDFGFNYEDDFQDDPFASQVQFQMDQPFLLQDMFMYLQKPF